MANIDFGTLVSAALARMDATESELTGEEREAPYAALQHYKREVAWVIREVFDAVEAEARGLPTCSHCGAVLRVEDRFCDRCGRPLTVEATGRRLVDLLAKDAGMSPDDPLLLESLSRLREEQPEAWNALLQKIAPRATA